MSDMLVKLYDLTWDSGFVSEQAELGICIRKPIGPEKHVIIDWVKEHFSAGWASETDVAISRVPGACFIAVQSEQLIGFACYDATALGFFGPIGVQEAYRGKRTGNALLRACLLDMTLKGYGYAIIGQAGAVTFFEKSVGAVEIKDSTPGIYHSLLRKKKEAGA
ncbi:MAG: GNAT family N-acetyltransferase [Pseudomonadota bacterium]